MPREGPEDEVPEAPVRGIAAAAVRACKLPLQPSAKGERHRRPERSEAGPSAGPAPQSRPAVPPRNFAP
ncbi:hypothetical protein GCM10027590_44810 [Nocardiopsis nanhaiensis]